MELDKESVLRKMRGEEPEPIREHLVEMLETVYPPKQVLATVTGWDRTSFTTMEAQRVLSKVGFVCRRASRPFGGQAAWVQAGVEPSGRVEDRVAALEAQLTVAQQAIVGLTSRVNALEARD
ncbi:hypothetical protein ACFWDK_25980 [Micromonospora chalcea]|uniref:hypothetical protein n=1 Tax=Micromonospora sp. TSRI0369 TaxID=1703936 RepID=UPI00093FD777|nr:hypothetical protein [Micromonospora sp. TSRI0369]OKJ44695.1 hypothetical protein AMK25_16980 [Micromonospora sp. TSRI0369]